MKKLWTFLDGKKTVLFMSSSAIMRYMIAHEILPETKWILLTIDVLSYLGGASLLHKGGKAYNNKKKKIND